MMDRDLALALRSSRPCPTLAYERLYDAYGDDIYRECRHRLSDADQAQAVLRDTFIVAGAHIHRLSDPARLREWLMAIALAECEHHLPLGPPSGEAADPAADGPAGEDADQAGRDRGELGFQAPETRNPQSTKVAEAPGVRKSRSERVVEESAEKEAQSAHALGAPAGESRPVGLRLRVLSGLAGPDSEGRREHVAGRAAVFDREGFPVPASSRGGRPTRMDRVLPGVAVAVCVLLLLTLAVYILTRSETGPAPSWTGAEEMSTSG